MKEQRRVGLESGHCVQVGRHVYPWTVASMSLHYKNPTKHVGLIQSEHRHHLIKN